jgi:hypothetical protein
MSVVLLAIKFNHDPTSARRDALNLRKNASEIVHVPEWERGISVNAADSVAAYATKEIQGNTLTIMVKLERTNLSLQSVEVRAIAPPPVESPERLLQLFLSPLLMWPGYYYYYYQLYSQFLQQSSAGNVLGDVKARSVSFNANGETDFERFELQNVKLQSQGVGIGNIAWQWQYRVTPELPWQNFATSRHRIYSLLQTPTAPWQQFPFTRENTQLPWTDVLEYACRWATGARAPGVAATSITREIYQLGESILEYGCPIGAMTQYALFYFDCTGFLERLSGGYGNGQYVNCSDCATIVSSFANALGCDLWQSRMVPQIGLVFPTNPILGIGGKRWERPCGFVGFTYHEVAWQGAALANDAVFDACLLLNGSSNPTQAPFVPLLPANIIFGLPGTRRYLDRLVPPLAQSNCVPQPLLRQRRVVA